MNVRSNLDSYILLFTDFGVECHIFGFKKMEIIESQKGPCPERELFIYVPVYIVHQEARPDCITQLDKVTEGEPCPSPLCRGRMATSHRRKFPHCLGSQGEVTHCYARADGNSLLGFQFFMTSLGETIAG